MTEVQVNSKDDELINFIELLLGDWFYFDHCILIKIAVFDQEYNALSVVDKVRYRLDATQKVKEVSVVNIITKESVV